jgi:hypothetical protein
LRSGAANARSGAKDDAGTSFERRDATGARQNATLLGRGLLRRGFVEELARIPDTRFALLLPTPQNASGAGDSI